MRQLLIIILSIFVFSETAQAQLVNPNDLIYYEIGGGRAFRGPPSYTDTLNIVAAPEIKLGYSCGSFDIEESIKAMFNQLEEGFDKAVNTLIYAAQGAIASLPLYLLRRADPNLASMMENMMLRYEEVFSIAVKNCKQAEREILAGDNPYYDWLAYGTVNKWKEKSAEKAEGGEVPIQDAQAAVNNEPGCVIWINEEKRMCDEVGFETIKVVEEVVKHGHEQIAGGGSATGTGELGLEDDRLNAIWPDPQEAADAIIRYIGEYEFADMRKTAPSSTAPVGVLPDMYTEAKELKILIDSAVSNSDILTEEELAEMSIPGLSISQPVIDSLKNLPPIVRKAATERIATEFSLLLAMERINLARRLILIGSADPNVAASPARGVISGEILPRLEAELRLINSEFDVREKISKSTIIALLRNDIQQQHRRISPSGTQSSKPVHGGAVKQ